MAAFDFPNSPSVNDQYTANGVTFKWNGTIWQRISASSGAQGTTGSAGPTGAQGAAAGLTISTSAPGSPSAGDMWWDSDAGLFLTYYNDGNSSQWVEINQGPKGAQGATGPTGAQGATGSTGAQGAAGAQGATGAAGSNATISNNADNRVITGGSGTNLNGEANLTFDGSTLAATGAITATGTIETTGSELKITGAEPRLTFTDTDNNPDFQIWANAQKFAIYDSTNSATRLHINSSGSLGIGTVTPQVQTHIFGADSELLIERGGYSDAELWLGFPSGQPFIASGPGKGLKLGGNGKWNEGLHITSGGDVEVTGKLTFSGDGHTRGIELGADADLVLYHDNSDAYFDNNKGDFYIRNDGNSTSEVLRLQAKGGEQSITCTPNGNVSLYYDNSRKLFTTSGGVTVESTGNTPKVQFRGASNLDMGKIDVDQFATNYSMMRFFSLANGTVTEWMRLLDNGNFCVGGMVGSSNNSNIQSPGQGNGNTNVGSAMWTTGRFICNSASTYSSFGRNSSGLVLSFTRQGGDQGGISVAVGSVSYGSGSDYRLKENVVSLTDGITRVKQLVPKRFNFIEDTTNTLRDGFLAHEVSSIVPEAITGTKDAVDSDNNPVYQQIDQAKLVPLLTAALQEAITKIETLEAKVAALEGS